MYTRCMVQLVFENVAGRIGAPACNRNKQTASNVNLLFGGKAGLHCIKPDAHEVS